MTKKWEKSEKMGKNGKNVDFGENRGKTRKIGVFGVGDQKVGFLRFSRSMSGLVHLLFRII